METVPAGLTVAPGPETVALCRAGRRRKARERERDRDRQKGRECSHSLGLWTERERESWEVGLCVS